MAGLVFLVVLLALASGMAWFVWDGIHTGETPYPTKRATHRRVVSRAQEPAMYWVTIGLYAAIGTGSAGLAIWGVRIWRRP